MMHSTRWAKGRLISALAVAAAGMALAGSAAAQSNRPVTIVVPFAAGGSTDITTRAMQSGMSASLGADVAVKNTAGAGGTIGVGEVARARPNGTTIGMAPVGPLTTQPHLRKLPYDIDSFAYICLAYSSSTAIVVKADSEFNNLEELVTYAKAHPGELTFAVQAIGSIPHIAGLALADAAGIEMKYLPVDGDGPALKALLDGTADLFIPQISFLNSNKEQIKSLALLDEKLESEPDLATAAEQGYDLDFPIWGGLVAPAGTDAATVEKLEAACKAANESDVYQDRMKSLNQPTAYMGAAEFEAFVRETYDINRKLLEKAGLLAN